MENANVTNLRTGLGSAWSNVAHFIPNFLMFLVILVAGYYIARLVARGLQRLLARVGFDRFVERGSIRRMFERSRWTPSDVARVVIFWSLFLFVLQMAFSVFGPNPVSNIITNAIGYLPNIFAAIIIVIVAAAVAAAAKQILRATLGGGSGAGSWLATAASAAIITVGIFAALDQLGVAPAIVRGLFYALLGIVVGSAVIAIGCGGIAPMRAQWEKAIRRVEAEAPKLRASAASASAGRSQGEPRENWQQMTQVQPEEGEIPERPRFPSKR